MARAGRDRAALADPDRAAPANPEDPADLEAPAVPEDRVGLAGRASPEGTSPAARAITAADTGLVALANQADRVAPVNRVGRVAPADLVRMSLVIRAVPASRVAPAVRDPGRNRALRGRAALIRAHLRLPDLHRMRADLHRMRARPHLTPARPQEQTHPEVATHRPVPIHLAEVMRQVEATQEADTEGAILC